LKRTSLLSASREAVSSLADDLSILAQLEELPGHAAAVQRAAEIAPADMILGDDGFADADFSGADFTGAVDTRFAGVDAVEDLGMDAAANGDVGIAQVES
jgi:hypothetical protein